MKKIKMLVAAMLAFALCAGLCPVYAESAPECSTFAYGCFGYRVPFLIGTEQQEGKTVHSTMMGNYTVTAARLDAAVETAEAACAAAAELLGMEVQLCEGENGVFCALQQEDYAYCLTFVKGDVLLSFAVTNLHYLYLLKEHVVVLDEEYDAEAPVQAPEISVAEYLPFEIPEKGMGVALGDVKKGVEAMLSQGELNVEWDVPVPVDEKYDSVTAYFKALGVCADIVYERESGELYCVQWCSFLREEAEAAELYSESREVGQTGAGLLTALLFAESGCDMGTFGGKVAELQEAFTLLQSWLDAVSNEALVLVGEHESSMLLLDSIMSMRLVAGAAGGSRVEACLHFAQ